MIKPKTSKPKSKSTTLCFQERQKEKSEIVKNYCDKRQLKKKKKEKGKEKKDIFLITFNPAVCDSTIKLLRLLLLLLLLQLGLELNKS